MAPKPPAKIYVQIVCGRSIATVPYGGVHMSAKPTAQTPTGDQTNMVATRPRGPELLNTKDLNVPPYRSLGVLLLYSLLLLTADTITKHASPTQACQQRYRRQANNEVAVIDVGV